MGSVLAASSPSPAPPAASGLTVPPGFGTPPVSPVIPPSGTTGEPETDASLPNPGAFDECHRRCKEVFPMQMEGVRLVVNKGLSNHFQVNHTVLLSTTGDSSYRFGATYVGLKQTGPAEFFPVMVGDMDNGGSLNAQLIHQLSSRIRSKLAFQTQQHKFVNWQGDVEFRGKDFTTTVTLGNPDVLVGSGIVVTHYLQSVTEVLALGGELVYHRRPGEEGAVVSAVGRYTGSNYVATLTLGSAGAHASYYHRASEQVSSTHRHRRSTAKRARRPPPPAVCLLSSCRSAWSLRPAAARRTAACRWATSWTCPKPTCSSKVPSTATGSSAPPWRRSCCRCRSRSSSAPSSTTARTSSSAGSASPSVRFSSTASRPPSAPSSRSRRRNSAKNP